MTILSDNTEPPAPMPQVIKPFQAIFLELEIDIKSKKFDISYFGNQIGQADLSEAAHASEFEAMVKEFADGKTPGNWSTIQRKHDYKSLLSIGLKKWTYLAFRLTSSKSNWRFRHLGEPLTVQTGFGEHAPVELSRVAYFGRRVMPDGSIIEKDVDTRKLGDHCRVAFFVIDGSKLFTTLLGQRVPFNFHLEVFDESDPLKFIPIIIDPDVGYPDGGSPP